MSTAAGIRRDEQERRERPATPHAPPGPDHERAPGDEIAGDVDARTLEESARRIGQGSEEHPLDELTGPRERARGVPDDTP